VIDPIEPVTEHLGTHVVRHVLLVPERPIERRFPGRKGVGHDPPVGGLARENLGAAGMGEPGRREVGGVERLVAHHAVAA